MIPTVEFNIIFQLTHIYSHLMNEGIGLRQLLDYYYVLCDFYKVYQKSSKTHPSSLTLKGGSTAFPKPLFNGLYTPFGSPVCGGQKPQERGRKPPSGARNRCAIRLSDHQRATPCCAGWDRLGKGGDSMGWACYNGGIDYCLEANLLITCRFLSFFLVVS